MASKVILSAIIIARNEEEFIGGCLRSLDWADEILVIDTGSTDRTAAISQEFGARVLAGKPVETFADWRNLGKQESRGEWLLYVDADERVTPKLKDEIQAVVKQEAGSGKERARITNDGLQIRQSGVGIFFIKRRNIFLGEEMRPDRVERLFYREALERWEGELSEHPIYQGKTGEFKNFLIHLGHRNLSAMLEKTIAWSQIEARLLDQSRHPRMKHWRFLRVVVTEAWRRLVKEAYWRYGAAGMIEAGFQTLSVFLTYVRLWQKQTVKPEVIPMKIDVLKD